MKGKVFSSTNLGYNNTISYNNNEVLPTGILFFYLPLSLNTNENADITFTFIYNNNNNTTTESPSIIDISYSLKCSTPFEFNTSFHWHNEKLYLQVLLLFFIIK